jgi:diguanylate cyclase (GGDEF)-like protein
VQAGRQAPRRTPWPTPAARYERDACDILSHLFGARPNAPKTLKTQGLSRLCSSVIRQAGAGNPMKRGVTRPRRLAPPALRQQPVRQAHPRAQEHVQEHAEEPAEPGKPAKARARSTAMRLAAEVERLAAQLEQSRSRIADLEAKIDVDTLTELLNRRGFERELKRSVAYVKRYGTSAALIYLDLDDFKPVNDRHGHAAGDAVLKAVAAALGAELRASDVVARLGGDEFVALLWHVSGPEAAAKAAALERAIYATAVRWRASTLVVGASAGIALVGALDTPADLLARADAAMYARKAAKNACPGVREAAGSR